MKHYCRRIRGSRESADLYPLACHTPCRECDQLTKEQDRMMSESEDRGLAQREVMDIQEEYRKAMRGAFNENLLRQAVTAAEKVYNDIERLRSTDVEGLEDAGEALAELGAALKACGRLR
jgi:hypothetical protein